MYKLLIILVKLQCKRMDGSFLFHKNVYTSMKIIPLFGWILNRTFTLVEVIKGLSIRGFIFIYKKNACFFVENHLIFISFNSGRFAINNKKQYHLYGLHGYVCGTMLFSWNFPLHFRTFGALFRRYRHEYSLWVFE